MLAGTSRGMLYTTSVAAPDHAALTSRTGLCRAVGPWDLTALGINQVIGGAIFLIPAAITGAIGYWCQGRMNFPHFAG